MEHQVTGAKGARVFHPQATHAGKIPPLLSLHLGVFLAGGASLFAKFLTVSPAVITCGRTFFASLALMVVAVTTRPGLWQGGHGLRPRRWRDMGALALSGVILAAHWMTFVHSIQVSTVAIGLLAFSTFPLFVTFLEPFFFRERLHARDVLTALLVMAGLALVTPGFSLSDNLTQGVVWGVVSGLAYALYSLLSRSCVHGYRAVTVTFWQQAFAALATLPLALQPQAASVTGRDVWLLLVLGVVFTALVQGLIVASLRNLRAQTASVAFGLEPVYGILLAWLLLQEVPAARTLLGGALICGTVIWASLR